MDRIEELLGRYPRPCPGGGGHPPGRGRPCAAAYWPGGKVLTCGNGGSAADAEHVVGGTDEGIPTPGAPLGRRPGSGSPPRTPPPADLIAGLQGAIPAICLNSQTSLLTAPVQRRETRPWCSPSRSTAMAGRGTSCWPSARRGNSANVANAHCGWPGPWAAPASSSPGAPGGRCADLAEVAVLLPETETYKVQELTLAPLPLPLRHAGGRGVRSEQETPPLRESVFPGDFN